MKPIQHFPLEWNQRLQEIVANPAAHLNSSHSTALPLKTFLDPALYDQEINLLFKRFPMPLIPVSEIPRPGDYVTQTVLGVPLLILRDTHQNIRVFKNKCRHRGAKVMTAHQGHCKALKCGYHGWTYGLEGSLKVIPDQKLGFANLNLQDWPLEELPTLQKASLVWTAFNPHQPIEQLFTDLKADESYFDQAQDYVTFQKKSQIKKFNWKIGAHAFLESYHFKETHDQSVAPLYISNRFWVQPLSKHLRVVVPKASLLDQAGQGIEQHFTVVYAIFPATFIFFMGDHLTLIRFIPIDLSTTQIDSMLLIPETLKTEQLKSYWDKNYAYFDKAVEEDNQMAEGIQEGLASQPQEAFQIGSFEEAILIFQKNMSQKIQ